MNAAASSIRVATPADIEVGLDIVRGLYQDRDIDKRREWIEWMLQQKNHLLLIGDSTVGCARFYWRYGNEPRARLEFIARRPGSKGVMEPVVMLRMMVAWARSKGAKGDFIMDNDTNIDFSPLADRIGGTEKASRYWAIPLEG